MPDIEDQLREAGAGWRADQRDPIVDLERATKGTRSRRVLVLASIAMVVLVPVAALVATRSDPPARVEVTPTTAPPTILPPRPDVIELNSAIVQPDVLAVDGTRLWVSGYGGERGTSPGRRAHLQQIDSERGNLFGDIELPDDGPFEMHVGNGVVWVAAQNGELSTELLKIDTTTMRIVARVPRSISGQFAVAENAVWATDGSAGLLRIDPETARVVATIPLHNYGIYPSNAVVVGALGVFAGNGYDDTIQRIDETANTAGPEMKVESGVGRMVELNGSLWLVVGSRLTEVVNGETPKPPIELGEQGVGLVTDGRTLWLATNGPHVLRVDPATGAAERVALPPGTRATTIAADPATGTVWATSMTPTPRLLRVPTGAPGAAPERTGLRSVDWQNSSIPARVCGGVGDAVLRKGYSTIPSTKWPKYTQVGISAFGGASYADLDGDGEDEAAVPVVCHNGGGTASGLLQDNVVVFKAGPDGERRVLGILHTTQPGSEGGRAYFGRAHIERGIVVADELWYGPYDSTCCPSGRATTVWTYDGTTLHAGKPNVTVKPDQKKPPGF